MQIVRVVRILQASLCVRNRKTGEEIRLHLVAAGQLALTRRLFDCKPSCWPVIAATTGVTVVIDPFWELLAGGCAEIVRKTIRTLVIQQGRGLTEPFGSKNLSNGILPFQWFLGLSETIFFLFDSITKCLVGCLVIKNKR